MQSGEFIVDRWMPGMIRDICERRGIAYESFSDDWMLRLSKGQVTKYILGYKFSLNDSAVSSIAQDKVATYQLLQRASISAIPHLLARTKATAESEWKNQFQDQFVVKPLTGTSGHGIKLFSDVVAAENWMKQEGIEAWAIAPFVKIKTEIRMILLGDDVLASYEKQPVTIDGLAMFNLGKGATAKTIEPTDGMTRFAQSARKVLGLEVCAIDLVVLDDGAMSVLEINDGIMMENYMRQSDRNKAIGYRVYETIIEEMMH